MPFLFINQIKSNGIELNRIESNEFNLSMNSSIDFLFHTSFIWFIVIKWFKIHLICKVLVCSVCIWHEREVKRYNKMRTFIVNASLKATHLNFLLILHKFTHTHAHSFRFAMLKNCNFKLKLFQENADVIDKTKN